MSSPSKSPLKKREKKADLEGVSKITRRLYMEESDKSDTDTDSSDNKVKVKEIRVDVEEVEFYDSGIPYFQSNSTKGFGREDVLSILISPDTNRVSLNPIRPRVFDALGSLGGGLIRPPPNLLLFWTT